MTAPPNGNYTTNAAISLLDGINLSTYHTFIERTSGFIDLPNKKESLRFSWPDEHGLDVDLDAFYYDERKCSLDLIISGTSNENLISNVNALFTIFAQTGYHHLKLYGFTGIFTIYVSGAIAVNRLTRGVTNRQLARMTIPLTDPYPVKYIFYSDQTELAQVSLEILTSKTVNIDWGDGSISTLTTSGTATHDYTIEGDYCILVLGGVDGITSITPVNGEEITGTPPPVPPPPSSGSITADSTEITADDTTITADNV